MNISPVNKNRISFGKINWGPQEQARKTAKALISLKEANDIDGTNVLKYSDVKDQLQILSEHPDTFDVKCSILEEYSKNKFQIMVSENESKFSLGIFERYFIFDKQNKQPPELNQTDIKSFAKSFLNKHQRASIKNEVEEMMKQFGETE